MTDPICLACSSLLFVYFFQLLIPFIGSLDKWDTSAFNAFILLMISGFSPEIFEGVVAFSGVAKLGSITNVTQSAT